MSYRLKRSHVVVIGLITGAMTLTACGGDGASGSSDNKMKLTFANYTEAGPVFHATTVKLNEQIDTLKAPIAIQWFDNQADPSKMLENARLMVQAKPDVIIEYPVAENSAGVEKVLSESGIPCIALNLPAKGCHFINIDNPKMGASAAALAVAEAKTRGWKPTDVTVLIGQNATAGPSVNGNVTTFYSEFAKGFGLPERSADSITPTTSTIDSNGIQFDGKSDQDASYNAVRSILSGIERDRKIILYTCNDDQTQGAYRAITGDNRGDNVIVIGHGGGRKDTLKALRDDPNWVGQDVFFEDYWGQYVVAMAQALVKGEKTPEVTLLPSETIAKKDLGKYFDTESFEVKKLPPLEADNEYLSKGGFLQSVGNVEGLS